MESFERWWNRGGEEYADRLRVIMGELFQTQEIPIDEFSEIVKDISKTIRETHHKLMEDTKDNKKLADLYTTAESVEIGSLNRTAGILSIFLLNQELIARLEEIFKKRKDK